MLFADSLYNGSGSFLNPILLRLQLIASLKENKFNKFPVLPSWREYSGIHSLKWCFIYTHELFK